MCRRAIGVVWCAALVLASAPVFADDEPAPWADGVTEAQKTKAQGLLDAGNALFLDKKYGEALDRYELAVAAWDHPAIRFNMVRCLIQLERPVDAYDNLVRALAYGSLPLEEGVYAEALAYEKLLLGQIAEVEVSCKQADAEISLDGQPLLTCPGSERRRLAPGRHQIVGQKAGFLTLTQDVMLLPGKEEAVVVKLERIGTNAVITHRWAAWKPWAVVGGGLLFGGLGGLLQLQAISNMDQYNARIAACGADGCDESMLDPDVADLESTALLENKTAIGMMIAGGATVVTGAVLVFMNRGRTTYPDERSTKVAVTPLREGGATVSLSLRY